MSKTYIHDGWTFETHPHDLDLFTIPSKTIIENNSLYIQRVHIAHSKGCTRIVYFVSARNGDEFGQFRTELEAMSQFNKLNEGRTK